MWNRSFIFNLKSSTWLSNIFPCTISKKKIIKHLILKLKPFHIPLILYIFGNKKKEKYKMYIYVHIKKEYIEIYVHWIRESGPPLSHDLAQIEQLFELDLCS